jgi:hypothetical protein
VFLLQPGELGFEFARVFMGHAWPKTDRLEIKAVDVLWKLSSLRGVIASDLERRSPFPRKIIRWNSLAPASALISPDFRYVFLTHASLHMKSQK